jgi:hypothetical protein
MPIFYSLLFVPVIPYPNPGSVLESALKPGRILKQVQDDNSGVTLLFVIPATEPESGTTFLSVIPNWLRNPVLK